MGYVVCFFVVRGFVECCLFDVCWLLFFFSCVVRCLFVVRCVVLIVVCRPFFVICWCLCLLFFVVCGCSLFVLRCVFFVV